MSKREHSEPAVAEEEDPTNFKKPLIGMRWVLVLLCNLLFLLASMITNSLSITIVAMVNSSTGAIQTDNSSESDVCLHFNDTKIEDVSNNGDYDWTSTQQGFALGGYFWGFFIGRIFGGRLGERIGQTMICGIGMTLGAVIVALSPLAADINVYWFIAARFLLGLVTGPILPAVYSLMSKWAPRSQLATMIAISDTGFTIGGTIGMLMSGWIVESFGWRWVFRLEAALTLIWVPFWFFYVRNDPSHHPYVTPYEAKILEGNSTVVIKKSVPWKQIIWSPYLYVCMYGLFARSWSYSMQFTAGPSYFSKKIGLELSTTSLVSGISNLLSLPLILFYGRLSDFLVTGKYMKKIRVRKMMHTLGTCGPALFFILLTISGCNISWTIALYGMIGVLASATACSIYLSVIDFAPNYTGTIMGLLGLGNIGGSLAPIVTSYLVITDNGWNKSFYLTASLSFLNCIVYALIMTDKPQSWDNYHSKTDLKEDRISQKGSLSKL